MKFTLAIFFTLLASMVASGCNREPLGFQIKNGEVVYISTIGPEWENHRMTRPVGADPATFVAVPNLPGAPQRPIPYARDAKGVFLGADTHPYQLEGCDSASFRILTADGKYTHDAKHVYYCGLELPDADPASFQVLDPPYSKDKTHVYAGVTLMNVADPQAFEVVMPGDSEFPLITAYPAKLIRRELPKAWGWGRDGVKYYRGDRELRDIDYDSFEVLDLVHAKDKNREYGGH